MIAVIYCRVSTTEQVAEGNSLLTQERLCRQYAKSKGYDVDKVFVEEGESAKTIYRTSLQQMMRYCTLRAGKVDALLIYKIDRLSRETADYLSLKVFFNKLGIKVESTSEPIEDTPVGRFIENVLASGAQMDNEIRGERSKNGMIEALKQGRWVFPAPFGYHTVGEKGNSNIEPLKGFEAKISFVFSELSKGYNSIEEVRNKSYENGLTRADGRKLAVSHFNKLIRNPVYKGYMDVPSMGVLQKGNFNPIVQEEIFDRVQLLLNSKKKKMPIYKKLNPDFPLRSTLKCANCGKPMTASWAKPDIGHYRCTNCNNMNLNKKVVESEFSHYLSGIKWDKVTVEIVKDAILLNWESHREAHEKKLAEIGGKKLEIKALMDKIIEKNIQGVYGDDITKKKLSEYESKMSELNVEALRFQSPEVAENELIEYSLKFLKNMVMVWEKIGIEPKYKLQKLLFPDGLFFLNGKFTTPVKSCIVELNELVSVGKSTMVTPNESFYNQLTRELVSIGNVIKDYELVEVAGNPITKREYN